MNLLAMVLVLIEVVMKSKQRVKMDCPAHGASHWTREMASKIKGTPANTVPPFDLARVKPLMKGHHVWDSWFMTNAADGTVAQFMGYRVLIGLTRPVDDTESAHSRMALFYSKDGEHYTFGGYLFETPLFADCQEWSGSTILRRDGKMQTFYTVASSYEKDGVFQTRQRFATAIQDLFPLLGADDAGNEVVVGLGADVPTRHALLAEPDGLLYETVEQACEHELLLGTKHSRKLGSDQTENTCWRDILYYECPRTGRRFGLFEANTGIRAEDCSGTVARRFVGSDDFEPDYRPTIDDLKANGCIGILEFMNDDNTFVQLMPPVLTSNLVTDEIERINVIDHDGHVYLFCVGHGNKNTLVTHNEDLVNRDYLLGFRGKSLFGPFEPLNGSGVVIQQKSAGDAYAGQEQNQQYVYSWKVCANGGSSDLFDVIAYANYSTVDGQVVPIKTAAPTLVVRIHGNKTELVDMKYDVVPA